MRTRRDLLVAAALVLGTFLLFAQARHFDFIHLDDPDYVSRNDRVLSGLSVSNIHWAFTTMRMANWHPLAWMSHMLDVQVLGPEPGEQHLVSVGIHAINVVLVYLVLVSLTGRAGLCAIVATLFAVHPLRMESVVWISERKDVLCAMFFLIAVGSYGQYVKTKSWKWYGGVIVAFALGIMAKPMIVSLPFVLLLVDCWPLKRPARWGLIVEKVPLFVMAGASSVVTFIAQRGAVAPAHYPLGLRLANAVWAYGRYVKKTFLPDDLAAFYPYYGVVAGTQMPWGKVVASAVVLVLITAVALWMWRTERAVLVGWLWFGGMLVPTIGLVQVGMQSMADRYSYLPQIGLFIALVWGGALLAERWMSAGRMLVAAACVFASVLAISTAYQLRYWASSYTLFQHAMTVTDHNPMANMVTGIWLTFNDRGDDAIRYYQAALKLEPGLAEAHNNLGTLLGERGQNELGLEHLRLAIELKPNYAEAHNNLGNLLAKLQHPAQAIDELRKAIRLNPDSSQAHYNLAMTLNETGDYPQALGEFETALRLRPTYANARFGYALALVASEQVEAGKREFERFLELRPKAIDAMAQFAWALATSPNPRTRDPQGAIALAEHVNQLTLGDNPTYLDTLAAAYAAAGEFDRAVSTATRARDLAAAHGATSSAQRMQNRIELYRQHQPFISSTQPAPQIEKPVGGLSIPASKPENYRP